jgi:hypothetical protein
VGDKILLFKRPNIPLDRALISPLASIKESILENMKVPVKTEKKRKKQSPDGSAAAALSKESASITSLEGYAETLVKDLKTI